MANTRERKVPALVDKPMDFCPGCGHGIVSRLIMECLEELEQLDNIIFPIGVGCSSNLGAGLECDRLHCCHGRAGAVATGMKRVNPDTLIVSYQGDGDAYLGEKLASLVERYDFIKETSGLGLMRGLEFTIPVGDIVAKSIANGLLIISAGTNIIRFVPPLVITKENVDEMYEKLDKILSEVQ